MRRANVILRRLPAGGIVGIALCLVIALGAVDYFASDRMSFTVFHVLIVLLVAWRAGRSAAMLIAVASSAMVTVDEWLWHANKLDAWIACWNFCVRVGVFAVVAVLVAKLRQFNLALEDRVAERTAEVEKTNADLQMQHAVTQVLAEADSLPEAARRLLRVTCEGLNWEVGLFWSFEAQSNLFHCIQTWHRPGVDIAEFDTGSQKLAYPPGEGLLGRVWTSGKPLWIADVRLDPKFRRAELAARAGLQSVFAFPILLGNEILGVIEFFSKPRREPDEKVIQMFTTVGSQIGQFIVRKRLEKDILEISDREQGRIGQDLHDGLCQHLVSTAFVGNALEKKLQGRAAPEAAEAAKVCELVDNAITQARNIARGLYPVKLEAEGLMSALQELAYNVSANFAIRCEFDCPEPVLISDNSVATHLYRIAQEAANNAIKHGKARRVLIELSQTSDRILLKVTDDGMGFGENGNVSQGMGLQIMGYRARVIGGKLEVQHENNGGTTIMCSLPEKEFATP